MKVLVVDDIHDTLEHITKLLGFESDIEVVGSAASGKEALAMAVTHQPDVVLIDVNMPEMDGIQTTEQLVRRVPNASVVMMSVQGEADYLRRAMLAGAREFLVKPFSADELVASLRAVHERGSAVRHVVPVGPGKNGAGHAPERASKVVAVFSPKGGVGRSTIAVNLAAAVATDLGKSVVLVDGSLQFGDVALLLNLNPRSRSVTDAIDESGDDVEALESALVAHSSGVKVLLPPPSPEMAELVKPDQMRQLLTQLRELYDLVVVDCWPLLFEPALTILEVADVVLCPVTLDLTSIKSTRMFLGVADKLGYDVAKIQIVLNRADSGHGISVSDVERSVGRKIDHTIVSDSRTVVAALNRGVPFYTLNRQAAISQDIAAIGRALVDAPVEEVAPPRGSLKPDRRLALARR